LRVIELFLVGQQLELEVGAHGSRSRIGIAGLAPVLVRELAYPRTELPGFLDGEPQRPVVQLPGRCR
jgi:hypothetical protein